MNSEALRTLSSVLIIVVGALLLWAALSRVTLRTRRKYESLLELAAQPEASGGALLSAQKRLTALRLVVNAARYAIVLIALLLILDQLDVRVSGILLPAGFLGAALGVGAQNVVRDILAGLFFLFEAQFAVGDSVAINGVSGTVEEVGVRVTRLRDVGGQEHFFPNGAITTVARYPGRSVLLLLRLPLLDCARPDELEAAVQASHASFAALFDRVASPPQRLCPPGSELTSVVQEVQQAEPPEVAAPVAQDIAAEVPAVPATQDPAAAPVAPPAATEAAKPIGFAWWRWEAHPSRAALWREKFAPQVVAELRHQGLDLLTGEAEVLNAPTEV